MKIIDIKSISSVLSFEEAAAIKGGAQLTIYEHINYGGASLSTQFNSSYVGNDWNDKTSSIYISSGTWRFYEHAGYQGNYTDLGPGAYSWVEDIGIPNDSISSFKVV